jgi:hypothetical protein
MEGKAMDTAVDNKEALRVAREVTNKRRFLFEFISLILDMVCIIALSGLILISNYKTGKGERRLD